MQEIQVVVFNVGKESYGLDIGVIQGIENVTDIINTPNSPDYIKGIINLRGEVIPIYNLRAKFGLPDIEVTDTTKFVIVKTQQCTFALEVDHVENIRNIQNEKIFEIPMIIKNGSTDYFEKVINIEGRLVILMDPINLLPEDDREKLNLMMNKQKGA